MSNPPIAALAFLVGAIVSLAGSWAVVSRIERLGQHLGLSEALVGLVAALAGDGPEITSAVTAIAHHDRAIGAGVVLGSNVFNLAALLGLGAVVAGTVAVHRRVVAFSGTVALVVALVCLLEVSGVLPAALALAVALAVLLPYAVLLGLRQASIAGLPLPEAWCRWLCATVLEEEEEAVAAIHLPRRGGMDALTAAAALAVVVGSSIVMEMAASSLGRRAGVPGIIVGGVVLAAVTSVPNAVAAIYLARRQRGVAVLSTALNSNSLNSIAGFLLPAAVAGAVSSPSAAFVAAWYGGLSVVALAYAFRDRALRRGVGLLVIAAYGVFVGSLLVVATSHGVALGAEASAGFAGLLVVLTIAARRRALAPGRTGRVARSHGGEPRPGGVKANH